MALSSLARIGAATPSNYAVHDWSYRIYHSSTLRAVVLAFLAAILAFLFNRHLQKQTTRERLKSDSYDKFAEKASAVNEALVDAEAAATGFNSQLIVLRSIHSRLAMGIPGTTEAEVNAEVRGKWNKYVQETADKVLLVTREFSKLHRQVELSYFMYPDLEKAFKLLVEDFREYFEAGNDYTAELWKLDPLDLINENKAESVKKELKIQEFSEASMNRLVHNEDFFYMVQHELLGKLFRFKVKTRTEAKQGKLLTKKGWEEIESKRPTKKDS